MRESCYSLCSWCSWAQSCQAAALLRLNMTLKPLKLIVCLTFLNVSLIDCRAESSLIDQFAFMR